MEILLKKAVLSLFLLLALISLNSGQAAEHIIAGRDVPEETSEAVMKRLAQHDSFADEASKAFIEERCRVDFLERVSSTANRAFYGLKPAAGMKIVEDSVAVSVKDLKVEFDSYDIRAVDLIVDGKAVLAPYSAPFVHFVYQGMATWQETDGEEVIEKSSSWFEIETHHLVYHPAVVTELVRAMSLEGHDGIAINGDVYWLKVGDDADAK